MMLATNLPRKILCAVTWPFTIIHVLLVLCLIFVIVIICVMLNCTQGGCRWMYSMCSALKVLTSSLYNSAFLGTTGPLGVHSRESWIRRAWPHPNTCSSWIQRSRGLVVKQRNCLKVLYISNCKVLSQVSSYTNSCFLFHIHHFYNNFCNVC